MGLHTEILQEKPQQKIDQVRLIISSEKVRQFGEFGNFSDNDYPKIMKALVEGRPYSLLKGNRIGRRIVRGMLIRDEPTIIYGRGGAYFDKSEVPFPDVLQRDVFETLTELKYGGLLDSFEDDECNPTKWAFNSELIAVTKEMKNFQINSRLRLEVDRMLSPLEVELGWK